MILYTIFTALNLLGMGFLFYVNEQQKRVNSEFLDHAILNKIIHITLKDKVETLESQVKKLEEQLNTEKEEVPTNN